jgi:hypothetical protein
MSLFDDLQKEAFAAGINPRSMQARDWFRKKAKEITSVDRRQLMRDERVDIMGDFIVGGMFMFFYNPKTKDKLPYYDSFPMVIIVDKAEGGFYGINLHYLPQLLRAKFLDGLLDRVSNQKLDQTTRFNITYDYLKSTHKMRYFKPCFKHYLTGHVMGNLARVSAADWPIATFLPTAQFRKSSESTVFRDSRAMI